MRSNDVLAAIGLFATAFAMLYCLLITFNDGQPERYANENVTAALEALNSDPSIKPLVIEAIEDYQVTDDELRQIQDLERRAFIIRKLKELKEEGSDRRLQPNET